MLIALVLGFDFLCVYAADFMGAPLVEGSVVSIGIAVALVIILFILTAAPVLRPADQYCIPRYA